MLHHLQCLMVFFIWDQVHWVSPDTLVHPATFGKLGLVSLECNADAFRTTHVSTFFLIFLHLSLRWCRKSASAVIALLTRFARWIFSSAFLLASIFSIRTVRGGGALLPPVTFFRLIPLLFSLSLCFLPHLFPLPLGYTFIPPPLGLHREFSCSSFSRDESSLETPVYNSLNS